MNSNNNRSLYQLYLYFVFACSTAFHLHSIEPKKQNHDVRKFLTSPIAEKRRPGYLKPILQRRYLRVLVGHNHFDLHVDEKGHLRGHEHDLVELFVRKLNQIHFPGKKDRKLVAQYIPTPPGLILQYLLEGRGDMAAAGLAISEERKKKVLFSRAYLHTKEVFVQKKNGLKIETLADLQGRSIYIRKGSIFLDSVMKINEQLKEAGLPEMNLILAHESISSDGLMEIISESENHHLTILHEYMARPFLKVFAGLKLEQFTSLDQETQLAWAFYPNSWSLLKEANTFIPRVQRGNLWGNVKYQEYFKDSNSLRNHFLNKELKLISPYDHFFKKHAREQKVDWRLMVSIAYTESKFDQSSRSPMNAHGIMQVRPSTAKDMGIREIAGEENIENNISAGIQYFRWLYDHYFKEKNLEEKVKIRLVLAAYNAGAGNVNKARKKARTMGLSPNKWFGHVEHAFAAMGFQETVNYVLRISKQYYTYTALGF